MSEAKVMRYRLNTGESMSPPDARRWRRGHRREYTGEYVQASDYDALLQTTTDELSKLSKWNAALNDENALLTAVAEAVEMECTERDEPLAPGEHPGPLWIALDAWTRSKEADDA